MSMLYNVIVVKFDFDFKFLIIFNFLIVDVIVSK